MSRKEFVVALFLTVFLGNSFTAIHAAQNPMLRKTRVLAMLPPGPDNPRNSEGSFVKLKDGRLLFAYSRFSGSTGNDDAPASIVGRYSSDYGKTWNKTDTPIVSSDGSMNVMSASLLRLHDGRIALFYVQKKSTVDAHVYVRFSTDETHTWSAPVLCIHDPGYYVLNNDRVIQTHTGRIIIPVALNSADGKFSPRGTDMAYLSDDGGATWRRSKDILICPTPSPNGLQEPGVVELKDGRIMMFMRTSMRSQYLSYSSDGGEHWTTAVPSTIKSPLSPASIKRIPSTGDLLLVWNDHSRVDPSFRATDHQFGKRTPLTVAISKDDGKTWTHARNILTDPNGCYCYTAIAFVHHRVLLGFSTTEKNLPCLSELELLGFPVKSLYKH
ncbi:MAG: sialidase family protein [Acidobacteriaceae bacterium]